MDLFKKVSIETSKLITQNYSTSFSMGIKAFDKKFQAAIYSIYGFVRLADEIVDTFFEHNQAEMLEDFRLETYKAIENKIHMNPVLNAFQSVVHTCGLTRKSIDAFLHSMEMDLHGKCYDSELYEEYIYGSAEVVGLMCLRVFVEGDEKKYEELVPFARSLGAAFQKVNFLRDFKSDFEERGRVYFPGVDFQQFSETQKRKIEEEINADFDNALIGIKNLPKGSRLGVYSAYLYYRSLFAKIESLPAKTVLSERIRVPDFQKAMLFAKSYFGEKLNYLS